MGRASFVVKSGVWVRLLFWYGGDSTPSEEWWIYFDRKLDYGESV